jgi:hypothetical protein
MTKIEATDSEQADTEKAHFLYEAAVKADEAIQKANERVTDKVKGFMSIAAALIPIIIGVGYFILKQTPASWVPILFALFLLSLGSLSAAIGFGIYLQRPLGFYVFNSLEMMKKHYIKSPHYVMNRYAITWSDIADKNLKIINNKQYYIILMLGLICAAIAVLIVIFFLLGVILIWQF